MNYLIVGTSRSLQHSLACIDRSEFDCVITSNGGIHIVEPGVYICIDQVACSMYLQQAKQAQANGTKLVTLKRAASALKSRGVDCFDEFLELGDGNPTRTQWGRFLLTGPLCLEYALRNGATAITVIGCDGYRHGNNRDYIDGVGGNVIDSERAYSRTMNIIGPAFMELAELFPEVSITQLGSPLYEITASNWEVLKCQPS